MQNFVDSNCSSSLTCTPVGLIIKVLTTYMTAHHTTRDSMGDKPLKLFPHVDNHVKPVDKIVDYLLVNTGTGGNKHALPTYPHRLVENPEETHEDRATDR